MTTPQEPSSGAPAARILDVAAMKALAHPLRVQILEALANYGAQTACGLGEMLNESSGSTSYHLRQLAKYEFVHEVQGKGTARERWWERSRGAIVLGAAGPDDGTAATDATRVVAREIERSRSAALEEFVACGHDRLPAEWQEAATLTTAHARLTAAQLADFSRQVDDFSARLLAELKDAGVQPGARPVQVHFNAFPLVSREAERSIPREGNSQNHTKGKEQ
ncbi:ArsR family transcriptional regulator [Pseudarthrobacter sp. P1]|uniref:ArsR family transcriptional regulator n=1 Tax=Pseudarthrobacter sp. P1 TaxID=3418418 RepID=UPI003CE78E3E